MGEGHAHLDGLRFGEAADEYDRARPSYPAEAVTWILGTQPARVLDLAAGTGKLTHVVVALGHEAVAVETGYRTLRLEREGALDWLTLDRPERLNAMDGPMCEELQDYFGGLYGRPATRVVILRGAGRDFCAGFDLKAAQEISAGPVRGMQAQRSVSEIILRMRRCPQPIIACVHGAATGGGFALALAADVRLAASTARMNVAMALVGLTGCDIGISYFLPRAVGASGIRTL